MATAALDAFHIALDDVQNLIDHHPKARNPGRGRPAGDEGPLNRACILLLYAAWEVYIEDSLIGTAEFLFGDAQDPQELPEKLRAFVAKRVKDDPWQLADGRWREVGVLLVTERVRGSETGNSFGMNTADAGRINQLHQEVLGVKLLERCRWAGQPYSKIQTDLDALVRLRGEIAHTGKAGGRLGLDAVRKRRAFVKRLAETLDAELFHWIETESVPTS